MRGDALLHSVPLDGCTYTHDDSLHRYGQLRALDRAVARLSIPERDKGIFLAYLQGESSASLAERHGLSRGRASQIVQRAASLAKGALCRLESTSPLAPRKAVKAKPSPQRRRIVSAIEPPRQPPPRRAVHRFVEYIDTAWTPEGALLKGHWQVKPGAQIYVQVEDRWIRGVIVGLSYNYRYTEKLNTCDPVAIVNAGGHRYIEAPQKLRAPSPLKDAFRYEEVVVH